MMQKIVVVLAALLVSATAFTTGVRSARKSSIMMAEKSKAVPFLDLAPALSTIRSPAGFDPLRLSDNIDIRWAQEAELKHCRIAMLAAAGFVFADFHNPVLGVSSALAHDAGVKSGALAQVLLWVHFAEIIGTKAVIEMYEGSGRTPGYFGFDPLKFSTGKPANVQADLQEKELQNGRLAMLAISGMLTQSVLTGKGFPYF